MGDILFSLFLTVFLFLVASGIVLGVLRHAGAFSY